MHVKVDADLCEGYGTCAVIAPEVFEFDENTDKAVVIEAQPGADLATDVDQATRSCPARAIVLE